MFEFRNCFTELNCFHICCQQDEVQQQLNSSCQAYSQKYHRALGNTSLLFTQRQQFQRSRQTDQDMLSFPVSSLLSLNHLDCTLAKVAWSINEKWLVLYRHLLSWWFSDGKNSTTALQDLVVFFWTVVGAYTILD